MDEASSPLDIEIEIVFANGQTKIVKEREPCDSTIAIGDIVSNIGKEFIDGDIDDAWFRSAWGLALYSRHCAQPSTRWINLEWLDPAEPLSAFEYPLKLVFGKKCLTDHNACEFASQTLNNMLYFQVLQMYLGGFVYCEASKAAKLSSLAAFLSTSNYMTSGTKWLEEYVPPRLQSIPQISSVVAMHMKKLNNKSEKVVKTAFIRGVISLASFGYTLHTAEMDGSPCIIGLKNDTIALMDFNTLEPVLSWNMCKDVSSVNVTQNGNVRVVLGSSESFCLKRNNGYFIKQLEGFVTNITYEVSKDVLLSSSNLNASSPIANDIQPAPDSTSNGTSRKSPISRNGDRRKAFRQKTKQFSTTNDTDNLNSIEELSALMDTNFTDDTRWTQRDSNPIYDSIAGSRIDATLRRANVTYSGLSTNDTKTVSKLQTETSTPMAAEYSQRLGMFQVEVLDNPEKKSKAVLPGELLKDYATLKKEFRMFCVKLPNGTVHWELASLYQPIRKLVARLCVISHIDDPENHQLTVEGTVVNYMKKTNRVGFENDHMRELTSSGSPLSQRNPSPNNGLADVPDDTVGMLLHDSLTFSDHGITSSRILALRRVVGEESSSAQLSGVIKLPEWVKFRQCWLSVVHGNHPCSLSEAITLAAILYQCYVLDRTEVNSVISFCNAIDFLPAQYAGISGIEDKILQERELLVNYTRDELQRLYITGVCSAPFYNYAFFACKEPRKQFLSNSKMYPILIGIGREGITRMNCKTKEAIDTWGYDVLKNWGHANCSFMLAFESSTYPVKCSQGKWMAELVSFHVQSIVNSNKVCNGGNQIIHSPSINEEPPVRTITPYFSLIGTETETTSRQIHPSQEKQQSQSTQGNIDTKYFTLEKVYDDLVQIRKSQVLLDQQTRLDLPIESHYVNPRPNCSLIKPDSGTLAQFQRLGLSSTSTSEPEEHLYDEVPFEGIEISSSDADLDEDEDDFYCNSTEPLYETPPDAI